MEKLNDDVETVKEFCYLGNALKVSDGSEMTAVTRRRIRWMRFRGCAEVLYGRYKLKMKEKVSDLCYVGSTIYIQKRNMTFEKKRSGII